jgi:hypothetical protein
MCSRMREKRALRWGARAWIRDIAMAEMTALRGDRE